MIIIFRRRATEIKPPGVDPFTLEQHITALSMRNKQEFLERMGAAVPVVEELAQVKKSTWQEMKGFFRSMENVGRMGVMTGFGNRLQEASLLPLNILQNRMAFMVEGLMMPLLPIVNKVTMTYQNYVMGNQTGALIGGAIGGILGAFSFTPFGMMGGFALGAGIGAGVEWLYKMFTGKLDTGGTIDPRVFPEEERKRREQAILEEEESTGDPGDERKAARSLSYYEEAFGKVMFINGRRMLV